MKKKILNIQNLLKMIKKTYTLAGIDNSKYSVHTL